MKLKYIFVIVFIFLSSCSNKEKEISLIEEINQDAEMAATYKDAYLALEKTDYYYAAKKFLEAELLYPQSTWAAKSVLMASYSYYLQNFYAEALSNLERYLITYPTDENLPYAHYLIAMCFYEMIEDEKRDTAPLILAKDKFIFIKKNYSNTDFALDAEFKIEFINDVLASKEMYLGRHYIKKEKWIAAINRFQNVIKKYEETIFIEEAIHRLVEINYKLGLLEESNKYAKLLGYNYLSSEWYKKSYKIFNQEYIIQQEPRKKKKKGVIKKFKKLFD